jgi:hypothetical protein
LEGFIGLWVYKLFVEVGWHLTRKRLALIFSLIDKEPSGDPAVRVVKHQILAPCTHFLSIICEPLLTLALGCLLLIEACAVAIAIDGTAILLAFCLFQALALTHGVSLDAFVACVPHVRLTANAIA